MDSERHRGKVVLITGGGSGMGRETALRFAREGASRIYLVDHFADRLERVAAELRELGVHVGPIEAELAEIAECERAVREAYEDAGRLDVVISNAAAWTEEPFLELKDESWQKVIAVILTAASPSASVARAGDGRAGERRLDPLHGLDLGARSLAALRALQRGEGGRSSTSSSAWRSSWSGTASASTRSAPARPTRSSRSTSSARSRCSAGARGLPGRPDGPARLRLGHGGRLLVSRLGRRRLYHRREPRDRRRAHSSRLLGAGAMTPAERTRG